MCKHLFHESCLSSWITARIDNPTCPMCNIQFYDDDSDSDEDGEQAEVVEEEIAEQVR